MHLMPDHIDSLLLSHAKPAKPYYYLLSYASIFTVLTTPQVPFSVHHAITAVNPIVCPAKKVGLLKNSHGSPFAVVGFGKNE